jgi:Ca2+-binding EF-hand superfamily protein
MRFHVLPLAAIVLSLASGSAFAQTAFELHDNNDDGVLSKDEFYGIAQDAGIFADYDANRDRRLDEDEFGAVGVGTEIETWDLDDDSYLDEDEFYEGTYDLYDSDGDGYLDSGEWDDVGDAGWFDV